MQSKKSLTTPVLFLVFNRPDVTRLVFEEIRKATPPRLYIASDGPRKHLPEEKEAVSITRKLILDAVNWDCEIHTLFRDTNLGCKKAVGEAITWFFKNEEMGIVLEDDCLPDQSFFGFCDELLHFFRDDTRIGQICGLKRFGDIHPPSDESYFYTRYGSIWGWASWRRAWKFYQDEISTELSKTFEHDQIPEQITFNSSQLKQRKKLFDKIRKNQIDTWDLYWGIARFSQNMLSVIPEKNLIENIGFGPNATHTTHQSKLNEFCRMEMKFPLTHRTEVVSNLKYDKAFAGMVTPPTIPERIHLKIRKKLGL